MRKGVEWGGAGRKGTALHNSTALRELKSLQVTEEEVAAQRRTRRAEATKTRIQELEEMFDQSDPPPGRPCVVPIVLHGSHPPLAIPQICHLRPHPLSLDDALHLVRLW